MNETSLVLKIEVLSDVYYDDQLEVALLKCNHLISNAIWALLEVELPKLLDGSLGEEFSLKLTTYTEASTQQ